jgi:hypothetical protein
VCTIGAGGIEGRCHCFPEDWNRIPCNWPMRPPSSFLPLRATVFKYRKNETVPPAALRNPCDRGKGCGGTFLSRRDMEEASMNGLIYLVGLVVVILAVLSFFGLR